jgi:uncharacterized membrane-anchored protein YitT (DUF2179 family)
MVNNQPIDWKHIFAPSSILLTILGAACAIFAVKGFMIPNKFLDGGVTGVSILLHEIYHINISFLVLSINMVFVYLGYKHIGKTFAVQSILAIGLLVIGLEFVAVPVITNDKLLIAVFGGFFIGIGMGLVSRAGAVLDGAEIIAVYTGKKIGISIGEIVMISNCFIFLIAAFKFGIETAMYSIITYFTAMKMCDYIADGIEEFISLNIISSHHLEIKSLIVKDFKKGIAVYKGERGYLPGSFETHQEVDIVVTIITRLELLKIKEAVYQIDPTAFMFVNSVKEAKGGVLKKKHSH